MSNKELSSEFVAAHAALLDHNDSSAESRLLSVAGELTRYRSNVTRADAERVDSARIERALNYLRSNTKVGRRAAGTFMLRPGNFVQA